MNSDEEGGSDSEFNSNIPVPLLFPPNIASNLPACTLSPMGGNDVTTALMPMRSFHILPQIEINKSRQSSSKDEEITVGSKNTSPLTYYPEEQPIDISNYPMVPTDNYSSSNTADEIAVGDKIREMEY